MMVTFVAQCEKKALSKTRRVLDAFASRIGSRTWQTVITNEGLKAVKKLLRQTATKNTAVSCHWLRSRSRSELMWIVGNRSRFNEEGIVPVNYTEQNIMNSHWENDWHYLPLIKSLVTLAGLFHDWGKSSEFFQTKLKEAKAIGDPLRHEWLAILFLNAYVGDDTDEQWLTRLVNGEIDSNYLIERVVGKHHKLQHKNKPLAKMPPVASLLVWLIVSHHRLPKIDDNKKRGRKADDFEKVFKSITAKWGYENKFDGFNENVLRCFNFPNGLPSDSPRWLKITQNKAANLLANLPLVQKVMDDGCLRLLLHHARLALVLADHNHSSKNADPHWQSELNLHANTDRATKQLKQKLDEHLVEVAKQGGRNAHLLPAFEGTNAELGRAHDVKRLQQKSPSQFKWQDKAVHRIHSWREQHGKNLDADQFGFFAVNMASTGTGKTFANAKIMHSLSPDKKSLRYILALGLRTLTLQTGDEYRRRIGLGEDELAVLIGSRVIRDLHEKHEQETEDDCFSGSESDESLFEQEIIFDSKIPEDNLTTILPDKKSRQLLYAPVLSCTIDHLMGATETTRGGRFILPSLRMMSSDLVIDEIDDFDGQDLIAIGRLIHLAGMLGRKVMISSATIPPDLAEGYFNVYQAGWSIFAAMRERSSVIGCGWIDEFNTTVQNVNCANTDSLNLYKRFHREFVFKRLDKLQQQVPKRQASIQACEKNADSDEQTIILHFHRSIKDAILQKHHAHHEVDSKTGKLVSFGVVRVANISPCIGITRYLLKTDLPDDVEIRTMAYHSQQVLLMRNEQEKHLDAVLQRGKDGQASFANVIIRNHLDNISARQVIFVLVATPVEEVGRDHDFDWAVVEPSSYRSFIQLAGRVRRHRQAKNSSVANVSLLQYNLKGLLNNDKPVFCRPGYESKDHSLITHDLQQLVNVEILGERLDAKPRISKNSPLQPRENLADLEHEVIHQLLTNYDQRGPETMQGWLVDFWWLTALPQFFVKFRKGHPQIPVYLALQDDGEWRFMEKIAHKSPNIIEETYGITWEEELAEQENKRLWLHRDYEALLNKIGKANLNNAAMVYGEIGLPTYGRDTNNLSFSYSSQLGLFST